MKFSPFAFLERDGDPYSFSTILCFHDFPFQTLEPEPGVEHHSPFQIPSYEDTSFGVVDGISGMNADTFKIRNMQKQGEPLFQAG